MREESERREVLHDIGVAEVMPAPESGSTGRTWTSGSPHELDRQSWLSAIVVPRGTENLASQP